MSTADEDRDLQANLALRARQGAGARYDAPTAPQRELSWARRGTAYFARNLNELSDADLDRPALVRGWTRRHVIAHVGYHARQLSRLVEAARKGSDRETIPDDEVLNEDIAFASTLPARALRYLFAHSEVHLNVEWRDLTDAGWTASVRSLSGEVVAIRQTPLLRAREVWQMAVALANGGRYADFPPDLLQEWPVSERLFPDR
jgi:maleylpyruvate isomerase